MSGVHFALAVVTSLDGFIARWPGDVPSAWASREEQALFRDEVRAADWSVLGRATHEAADRADRHRIVFSRTAGAGEWRRPTQFWIDPAETSPAGLADNVAAVRQLRHGLILGGTRVHDWFHAAGAIDRVHLAVEPVKFGGGLPIFTGQTQRDPIAAFADAGFEELESRRLNSAGTRYLVLAPSAR